MTEPRDPFAGPWFDAVTAARYVPCVAKDGGISLKAWHAWKRRHGIIARANGSVSKKDLDRELRRRKPRRVMHPASLANLRTPEIVRAGTVRGRLLGTAAAPAAEADALACGTDERLYVGG